MEKKVRNVCFDCHSKCSVILTVNDNDEIVRVEGDKNNPVTTASCASRRSRPRRSTRIPTASSTP